jgi:type III secretory pathway component EscU
MDGILFIVDVLTVLVAILVSAFVAAPVGLLIAYLFEVKPSLNKLLPVENAKIFFWVLFPILWILFSVILAIRWV